ncbi:hypothetical protein [Microbacterium sp. NPDC056234]|uniref:hypothetical protein n=1 Tax=Microbacterium sp. NPDC056234 TaxID=3345757 RepID=UPI0035E373EC
MNTRDIDSLVADTVAARPLPASYTGLNPQDRARVEAEAARRRLTPDAFWSLSRSRRNMTAEERYTARVKDAAAERERQRKIAEDADKGLFGNLSKTDEEYPTKVLSVVDNRYKK